MSHFLHDHNNAEQPWRQGYSNTLGLLQKEPSLKCCRKTICVEPVCDEQDICVKHLLGFSVRRPSVQICSHHNFLYICMDFKIILHNCSPYWVEVPFETLIQVGQGHVSLTNCPRTTFLFCQVSCLVLLTRWQNFRPKLVESIGKWQSKCYLNYGICCR